MPNGTAPGVGSAGSSAQTVILWDRTRIAGTTAEKDALATKLATLAGSTGGTVVDLALNGRISALNAQADANPGCVYAKNLVAAATRDVVQTFSNANLKYVVLAGGDSSIPFFRYPDPADLAPESWFVPPVSATSASEASLRSKYVLGQDEYGATTILSLGGTRFPVPDLAVGRLVESASEASGMIDAYLGLNGVAISPSRSLVTGYDFIADSAAAVQAQLTTGMASTAVKDSLINDTWTANQLRAKLLGTSHYDLMYLAGHFDASSLLAADFSTTVNASELAAPGVNLTNTVAWSTGCHAGYSLPDGDGVTGVTQTLDWAQAFARKGASLVAGTGFQYGDDELIEYSERIYTEFAHQLRVGSGPVTLGSALVKSKLAYLAATPDIRGMHEKALLTSALFGLPMFSVNMPGTRDTSPAGTSIIGSTSVTGGLRYADISVTTPGTPGSAGGSTYVSGSDGVASNPGEPVLPRVVKNVGVSGQVLRGVGFRGGAFTDTAPVTPLIGAPGTEFGGVQTPFTSTTFFPARMWTTSYFGGSSTNLVLTPAQHRVNTAGDTTATRRVFDNLNLRLFYAASGDPAAASATAPTISNIDASLSGTDVMFSATILGKNAAGADNVKTSWVTYTFGNTGCKCWLPIDLTNAGTDPTVWTGHLTIPSGSGANLRFTIHAANDAALVGTADNGGAFFGLTNTAAPTLAPSTLTISAPSTGIFGATANVSATLTGPGALGGRTVTLRLGTAIQSVVTNGSGVASATLPIQDNPGANQVAAIFGGDAVNQPAAATTPFIITKTNTNLTLAGPSGGVAASSSGVYATLKDQFGAVLPFRTVTMVVWNTLNPGLGFTRQVSTGFDGRAALGPIPSLTPGVYSLTAYFSGTFTLNPWVSPSSSITLTDPTYNPSASATRSLAVTYPFVGFFQPIDMGGILNVAKAGSAVPVKFSLGGFYGLQVIVAGFPKAIVITCDTTALTSDVPEEIAASTSGLQYDPLIDQYTYVWKTPKTYLGKCYRLEVKFNDGQTYTANFRFK